MTPAFNMRKTVQRLIPTMTLAFALVVTPLTGFAADTSAVAAPAVTTTTSTSVPLTALTPATPVTGDQFGVDARAYLTELSNGIGQRVAGTVTEIKGAEFVASKFKAMGYTVVTQPFTYTTEKAGKKLTSKSQNIMVVKPGVSKKEIIIGAHYDSVSIGRGADDNGSAVAVMLETAKRMKNVKSNYTLRFIAFGAEEVDLCGSNYYASKMSKAAVANTLLMVNMDSLVAGDNMYVYGGYEKKGLVRDWVMKQARLGNMKVSTNMGENPEFPLGTTGDFSDHVAFKNLGIQHIYFEGTNWLLGEQDGYTQVDVTKGQKGEIWHSKYDTLEYLDATFPGRVDEHLKTFSTLLYKVLTEYKF